MYIPNIPYQIVEAFEMMIVTILSAAVKCQWDLKPYQEAMITTVTLNLIYSTRFSFVAISDRVLWNHARCSNLGPNG